MFKVNNKDAGTTSMATDFHAFLHNRFSCILILTLGKPFPMNSCVGVFNSTLPHPCKISENQKVFPTPYKEKKTKKFSAGLSS